VAAFDHAVRRLELAEQDAKERRLAAAVRPEHADALAGGELERDVLDRRRLRLRIRGGEIDGAHEHAHAQPLRPPVKPRMIAFAFARSIARYVAPLEPFGPSVSP